MKWLEAKYLYIIIALIFFLSAAVAQESYSQWPHLFYGDALANDRGLAAGSVIVAKVNDSERGRITTTELGKYGGSSASENKMLVEGNIEEGAQIEFFVSRVKANETALFKSGKIENKNLTWSFPPKIEINGTVFNESITCTPGTDIQINVGSLALNTTCANATSGTVNNITDLGSQFLAGAPAPGGLSNISNVFEISVTGNFTITATITYSDAGIDESAITVYKFVNGSWTPIPSADIISIDTAANKITFKVSPGGTPYTSFGSPPAVADAGAGGGGGGAAVTSSLVLSISAPVSVTTEAGSSGTFNVTVTANNASAPATTVSVSGLPANFGSDISPGSVNISANGIGTFSAAISVPAGESPRTITFTIRAQSGTTTSSRDTVLAITTPAPANVTPSAAPGNITTENVTPGAASTPAPATSPPAPITGLVTANPAVAGGIIIVVLLFLYLAWLGWKGRKKRQPTNIKSRQEDKSKDI